LPELIGRRTAPGALTVLLLSLLAACAQLPLQEREILIPAAKLEGALAKRVSFEKKLLDVFSVKIDRPKLTTDVPAQRLRVEFALTLSHPFSNRPLTGGTAISGALGFDPASSSIVLLDPKLEALRVDAVPPALSEVASRLGSALGAELLAKYPLVALRDKDLSTFGREYSVAGFEVLADGVRVTLKAKE
jgi:hypothetical protein